MNPLTPTFIRPNCTPVLLPAAITEFRNLVTTFEMKNIARIAGVTLKKQYIMNMKSVAIVIYGETGSGRNAFTEEKYKDLAAAFYTDGFKVDSVLYNDEKAGSLSAELLQYHAVLVWVNPIEQGHDRKKLDSLLIEIAGKGCFVSAHPEIILKMGTKDILYKTRDMDWGGDVKMYSNHEEFTNNFTASLNQSGARVLKQYRGNGGNGVFKIKARPDMNEVSVTHATESTTENILSISDFYNDFKKFFLNNGLLIDQEWNSHIANGMVRCYLSGNKVAGFGYQEINALYELNGKTCLPGKRYYYTENCGLFADLKEIMENKWVPELQDRLSINENMLPVIWDADFFINYPDSYNTAGKYSLCEINVSCVSPFPPGAVSFIVKEVRKRTGGIT